MDWQEQIFIDRIQPEEYKPGRNNSINYANQRSVYSCTFSSDFKKINLKKARIMTLKITDGYCQNLPSLETMN